MCVHSWAQVGGPSRSLSQPCSRRGPAASRTRARCTGGRGGPRMPYNAAPRPGPKRPLETRGRHGPGRGPGGLRQDAARMLRRRIGTRCAPARGRAPLAWEAVLNSPRWRRAPVPLSRIPGPIEWSYCAGSCPLGLFSVGPGLECHIAARGAPSRRSGSGSPYAQPSEDSESN